MNVYDFDNTLYEGESGIDLFFFYLKKRPALVRYAPVVLRGVIDYKAGKITLNQVLKRYERILKVFLQGIDDYEADARVFWDQNEHRLRSFYRRLHRPDDLIISASPEQSLREVCKRLGVARYIGTVINETTQSLDFICFKENKVKAFRERYPNEKIERFYTDSMNDKPLMEIAEHVFFVKKGTIIQLK
ncbi:MAG: haloacid dehalogenase-like hydrolase [Oscillospiraceae bacterium]|jgi:phosphoserine phosphatase|nr:haloacid dehalogenase-like hydrolase [Oscillospiraceae bacterium]